MVEKQCERRQLLSELRQTQEELENAFNHLNQVVDPMLIDCTIHEIEAAQLRYRFLLKRVRSMETHPGLLPSDTAP